MTAQLTLPTREYCMEKDNILTESTGLGKETVPLTILYHGHPTTRLQPGKTPIGYMKAQASTQQNFIRGGFVPRSNPLPSYMPFLTEKVPLSYTFYWQMVPLLRNLFKNFASLFTSVLKCTVF